MLRRLEVDLKREHGPTMGGVDVFAPISAMSGSEGRSRCLAVCRNDYGNKGLEAVYKRKCAKVCFAMHPNKGELDAKIAVMTREAG